MDKIKTIGLAIGVSFSLAFLPVAHAITESPTNTQEVVEINYNQPDSPGAPAKEAKEDFKGGFKTVGRGFKNGTKATGRAFKKAGTTMGGAFKKVGGAFKYFFTGKWISKGSKVEERDLSATAAESPSTPELQPLPPSDLDAVGNEAPKGKKETANRRIGEPAS